MDEASADTAVTCLSSVKAGLRCDAAPQSSPVARATDCDNKEVARARGCTALQNYNNKIVGHYMLSIRN